MKTTDQNTTREKRVFIVQISLCCVLVFLILFFLVRSSMSFFGAGRFQTKNAIAALQEGNATELVYYLDENPHLIRYGYDNSSLLFSAVRKLDPDIVRVLLEKGADPNEKHYDFSRIFSGGQNPTYENGSTPLHELFVIHLSESYPKRGLTGVDAAKTIAKMLLDKGGKINEPNATGYTPLHIACFRNQDNLEIIKYLIENGADVNVKNYFGHTPITSCIQGTVQLEPNLESVVFLVEHGAEVNIQDNDGKYPLDHAIRHTKSEWEHTVKVGKEIVDYLKGKGARSSTVE